MNPPQNNSAPIDWADVLATFTDLSEASQAWLSEVELGVEAIPLFMGYTGDMGEWLGRLQTAVNVPVEMDDQDSLVW
jgi:hypothetical protein